MKVKCACKKYRLEFKFDAGTSRGVLKRKDTYFILICDPSDSDKFGIGECGPLQGLSIDHLPSIEKVLDDFSTQITKKGIPDDIQEVETWVHRLVGPAWPTIRFALETAIFDYLNGAKRQICANQWSQNIHRSIPINGLIWMGDRSFMKSQIDEKILAGYSCIKMKIGAIDFQTELDLLKYIRQHYDEKTITLRVDANGAFSPDDALPKLEALARLGIHSIEQPIKAGHMAAMKALCKQSPLPIALDEELIGVMQLQYKKRLLEKIQPPFIILKPTLVGGLQATREWIALAEEMGIGWWITSALESNVGLNAIAQLTDSYDVTMPQGLGTGQLYHNNITSPLFIKEGCLNYHPQQEWNFGMLT